MLIVGRVLSQQVPKLRYFLGFREGFARAKSCKPEDGVDEQEVQQDTSLQGGHQLHVNPTPYCCSASNSARPQGKTVHDKQCPSTPELSFQQQSNHSVSYSQHLPPVSSAENTVLDLAFNMRPNPKTKKDQLDRRAFLKCRPEYSSMSVDLTQQPLQITLDQAFSILNRAAALRDCMKPSDISKFFMELSRLHPDNRPLLKRNQYFMMFIKIAMEKRHLLSHTELLEVLQSFVRLDMPSDYPVLMFCEAELICRANKFSLHQLLFAADLLHCLGRNVPQFFKHLYDFVHLHPGQIGVPEVVQLLYIIGEERQCPKDLVHPIDHLLKHHRQKLYPEEVGIICLGLFKSQLSVSESTVNFLLDKAQSFVGEMSDYAIVNVLKYVRFSYVYHRGWMAAMEQEVPLRASRMGIMGLMHVALTCASLNHRNDAILSAISEAVPSLVSDCRSKDACKLIWSFGKLRFPMDKNPNFYLSLTETLRQRVAEFHRYPEQLLTGLLGLAFVSQFPEDLIELALSPDFVDSALTRTKVDNQSDLLTLDGTVALELPHWNGPRLSSELRDEITDRLWKCAQSHAFEKQEVREAISVLRDLLGGNAFVRTQMILPHTRSIDLEVHLDPHGKPIAVNPEPQTATATPENKSFTFHSNQGSGMKELQVTLTEDLIANLIDAKNIPEPVTPSPSIANPNRVEPQEGRGLFDTGSMLTDAITESQTKPCHRNPNVPLKFAIQVPSRNQYCYQSKQLVGLHAMKRRQLKLAGYRVIELYPWEWLSMLRKSNYEKLAYLHLKISNSFKAPFPPDEKTH
ncbi:FAST kinase domain-containing protein 5, mitochondrial [Aulostomus maculatus]